MASRLGKLFVTYFVQFTDVGRQVRPLAREDKPWWFRNTRYTISAFVPLAAFKPKAVLYLLYPDSYILQPLNLENTLPSLVLAESLPLIRKTIPGLIPGLRRE
jgi:hypothetical protein